MNFVIICADDVPHDSVQFMPYLDGEPGGNWVRFPNARLNTPLCGPSRVTHFSGRYAQSHGADTNDYVLANAAANQDESTYVPGRLAKTGRYVAHVGKYVSPGYPWEPQLGSPSNYTPPGWDDFYASHGSKFYDWARTANGVRINNETTYETDWSAAKAAELIGEVGGERPFLIWWDAQAPHFSVGLNWVAATEHENDVVAAWDRPPNHNEADVSDKPAWLQAKSLISSGTLDTYEGYRADAIRMMASLDEGIETIITALTTAGVLDDTVIIFWADNSFLFGEHRCFAKGVPYDEAIRMQMMVRWPGVTPRTDTAILTNADIPATILDVCGQTPNIAMDGMSFADLVQGNTANHRRDLPLHQGDESGVTTGPWRGVVSTDGWKYIEYPDTDEAELYDLTNDPYELANMAASNPAQAAVMARRVAILFGD